jgi:metallo-beta-lactamase family protein
LADGAKQVRIFGEAYERRARVARIDGLSAHAGQSFLKEYALAVKGQVKEVFLVHGEPAPALALSEKLEDAGMRRAAYPDLHQSVEL